MPRFVPNYFTLLLVAVSLACSGDVIFDAEMDPGSLENVDEFAKLVNEHRASIGCAVLQLDESVTAVAARHSLDMVERDYFDHTNPEGQSPFDRLEEANITYRRAGENIAAGQVSADEVLNDWLNSSGHRANIENCGFTHHGIGLVDNYWTHLFVTPR